MRKQVFFTIAMLLFAGTFSLIRSAVADAPASTTTTTSSTTSTTVVQTTTSTSSTTSTSTSSTTTIPTVAPDAVSALPQRCTQYEPLLEYYAPEVGWKVEKMSYYMWRESRCVPTVRSKTADSGLLQINDVHLDDLTLHYGYPVTSETLMDPVFNIQVAALLCEVIVVHQHGSCYAPWGGHG